MNSTKTKKKTLLIVHPNETTTPKLFTVLTLTDEVKDTMATKTTDYKIPQVLRDSLMRRCRPKSTTPFEKLGVTQNRDTQY